MKPRRLHSATILSIETASSGTTATVPASEVEFGAFWGFLAITMGIFREAAFVRRWTYASGSSKLWVASPYDIRLQSVNRRVFVQRRANWTQRIAAPKVVRSLSGKFRSCH